MKIQSIIRPVAMGVVMMVVQVAMAQTRDVSVSFLRAAVGSLQDRATVTLEAVYLPDPGLVESKGRNLKGKGFSRFSVRDTRATGVFTSLYCSQDSKAFKELVPLEMAKTVRLSGYKEYGENGEPAIFVTGVEVLADPVKPVAVAQEKSNRTYRVTIKDTASGNKTVLANVSPGKSYKVEGIVLEIELEPGDEPEAAQGESSSGPP